MLKPFVIDFQTRLHILLMLSSYFFRRLKQMFLCELYNQITTGMSLNFRNHHMHIYMQKVFVLECYYLILSWTEMPPKNLKNITDTQFVGMSWNIWYDHCLIWLNAKGVLNFLQYFKIEFDQTLFLSFICLVKVFGLSPKL